MKLGAFSSEDDDDGANVLSNEDSKRVKGERGMSVSEETVEL